jgi:ketosteroid isomerase-like protein
MDGLRDLYDPDAVMRYPEDWPEPGPYVGREAVMRQYERTREAWDADTAEPINDFTDHGDRVAVRYLWRGTGHGPEFTIEVTTLFTIRKAKIHAIEFFWDHSEALEIMGLSEQK